MKSSNMENIYKYNPSAEDAKTLSPLTYYQPFQSSFDPEFLVPPPKAIPWQNSPRAKRWGQSAAGRPIGGLHMSGGGILTASEHEETGFGPRGSGHGKISRPGASTSGWGDPEGRSVSNSTWRCPRPLFGNHEGGPSSSHSMSGTTEPGACSQFPPKGDGFGGWGRSELGLDGASFRQSASHAAGVDGGLTRFSYYPLTLSPLGKNAGQNVYKTGHNRPMMCNFCKNNKEVPDIYLNHYLYDPETKVLSCPVLRKHVCEVCGGTGDQAHTLQYCPVNRERGLQSKVPVLLKTRTITNSTGKIRRN